MRRKRKYIFRRIVLSFAVCVFFMGLIIMPIENAATQVLSSDIEEIDTLKYPGIKEVITSLKATHPNWNFKILYTGLDWYEVIQSQYVGHGEAPSNLLPANSSTYNNDWICSICGTTTYDTGEWNCASEQAIKYMMDPRNFLDESNIFQFLELSYTDYSYEQVQNMVNNTYLNTTNTIDTIIDSSKIYNVNIYYVIARLIQEQGISGTELITGNGYNGSYAGYYNAFNLGVTGSTKPDIILNGLKRAQKEGWTSLEASIRGGIKIIAENYLARGQNTLYLQKFDVENSDGILYTHQYMQNLLAAKNEALQITKVINNLGIDNYYNFIIPVFENMPQFTETEPNLKYKVVNDLVKVNVAGTLRMRNAPAGNQTIDWIKGGDILTRVEMAQNKVNGTYWDKLKSGSGVYGYVARETYENSSEYKLYLDALEEIIPEAEEEQNSEAELENEVIEVKLGDVNNDGRISPADYVLIQSNILQNKLLKTDSEKKAADVNGDGKISATDYVLIKNYIMYGNEI